MAAPYWLMMRARCTKRSSPSLSEMELTTALPCTHFNAASMTSKREESIIHGRRATSGSEAMRRRKWVISASVSRRPSSMLMSSIMAPSRTCLRAMASASSYCFSLMSRRNLRLPATLQRSPTLTKVPGSGLKASRPASQPARGCVSAVGNGRAWRPSAIRAMARMWSGVEPQHPPMMFTDWSSTKPFMACAIRSGVSE